MYIEIVSQALAKTPTSSAEDLGPLPGPVKTQGRDKPDYTLVTSLLNLSKSEVIVLTVNIVGAGVILL